MTQTITAPDATALTMLVLDADGTISSATVETSDPNNRAHVRSALGPKTMSAQHVLSILGMALWVDGDGEANRLRLNLPASLLVANLGVLTDIVGRVVVTAEDAEGRIINPSPVQVDLITRMVNKIVRSLDR